MKLTAKNILEYGGCRSLYRFHIMKYPQGTSVEYEQMLSELREYINSLPEDSDKSWVDWTLPEKFLSNYKAIENCGEVVVYHDLYKTMVHGQYIEADSLDSIKSKARDAILAYMKSSEEFFGVKARHKTTLFGVEGIGIYDIADPRTDKLPLIDYMITLPDANHVYVKTLEELETKIKSVEEEYIAFMIASLNIYQKIVADEKYDAWKPIS